METLLGKAYSVGVLEYMKQFLFRGFQSCCTYIEMEQVTSASFFQGLASIVWSFSYCNQFPCPF